MLSASSRRLNRFLADTRGNVAILFGVALIPILLGVGVAIDYGRALIVREHMADAADSAALAIGSWPGLTQAELKTKAQQYFDANFPPTKIGTAGALDVKFEGDDIKVTVHGQVPTTFMKLAHFDTLNITVNNTITKKERNIEVVLVLDTTGSMGSGGKLNAMKSAAKKMVDTLFDGKATSTSLKMGVVPFAAAVNIGSDKLNSGWLNKATYTTGAAAADPIPFEDLEKVSGVSPLNLYKGGTKGLSNRSWAGCVRERGGAYELTDDPPSSSTPATLWAPYFAPDEPDNSDFANNYLSDGSYSSASCYTGTSTNDKRQCFTGKYQNKSVSSTSTGPDYNCPPASITPLTNTRATVTSAIDALVAKGNTVIPAGLLWGWRVLSPGVPFTEGAPYGDEKWVKAVVLLTDGENDISAGGNSFDKSVYNAFGYAKNGHLGSASGSNAEATLDTKTLTICDKIKKANPDPDPDKKVQVYTIGFQVTAASKSLLKSCATKPDMFYDSPTNDQLAGIFQDIAQGLGELRIAQ
jgi:Flp pilus assembly protein TadG